MRILFVCTGNICRSPMAEVVARWMAGEVVEAASAGIHGLEEAPASAHAVTVLAEIGLDGSGHVARRLTPALMARADRIYVMTEEQRSLLSNWPGSPVELLDPGGGDIPDPYGRSLEDYRDTLRRIMAAVEARLASWVS
ncbi:MAG TPA: hypothetical protein VLL51_07990 [Gemmatimonadales bacterium]|nr:hypothetical protein [Gemmatimonadales bacterium]